jgi:sarcosine oxidase subunit alpha
MRLPPMPDEWLERGRTLRFSFEGRDFDGLAGDSVASALWASGERTLGRSFKYHRPRGLLSAANHDVNVLLQDGQRLNVRGDSEPLREGMALSAVNTFGGLARDRGRVLNWCAPFLPVGFYYKAFHDKRLFPLWERMFRRITGLGTVDFGTPHVRTAKRYDFCDVLVVGAGPSGLAAALAAAEAGARVVVVDENRHGGGSGLYQLGQSGERRLLTRRLLDRVSMHPNIRRLDATYAAAYYADQWVPLVDADKLTKMRARSVVVASGAFEQPSVFRNNDLPGVMLGSAMQRLIYRHAVRPARRAVVLAANADAYRVALDLVAAGTEVAAVVDLRAAVPASTELKALRRHGVECLAGQAIYEAHADREGHLAAVTLCRVDASGQVLEVGPRIACDGVAMSTGWMPAANLLYQAGTQMRYDEAVQQFVPRSLPPGVFACGKVNGIYQLDARLADGQRAGLAAAAHAGHGQAQAVAVAPETESPSHPWPIVAHPKGKNFVDFDEDLHLKDFENAVQEGYDNIELLKRFTTVGMGPSQGKHSNMTALRILARLTGKTPQQVGTTTARPFFHPVPLSHLAGRGFHPQRHTPLQARHAACGAVFMPAGAWERPEYYRVAGRSRHEAIRAEVERVRSAVGVIDVGTLGKLELRGPQAAEFLERVYTGRYANMKLGSTRYAVMCDESGVLVDEGVVARFADDVFYFTTTSSGAATVYRELSRLNAEWRLDCGLVNLTGAYAAMNLAGPKAREVLARLTEMDLSSTGFPYLACRSGTVAGVAARLMRVGFVGEWGYEIHVPAEYAPALWDALMRAGDVHGIGPFGVEAQRLLRLEKGHLIVGQDTDGLTTPWEVGMDWAVKLDKPFFVGQRSLEILKKKPLRQKLVGFRLAANHSGAAPQECHLVIEAGEIAGRVTSIAYSPNVDRYIGLAFVRPEMNAPGRRFQIRLSDGSQVAAEVCATPFFDPQDERQKEGGGSARPRAAASSPRRAPDEQPPAAHRRAARCAGLPGHALDHARGDAGRVLVRRRRGGAAGRRRCRRSRLQAPRRGQGPGRTRLARRARHRHARARQPVAAHGLRQHGGPARRQRVRRGRLGHRPGAGADRRGDARARRLSGAALRRRPAARRPRGACAAQPDLRLRLRRARPGGAAARHDLDGRRRRHGARHRRHAGPELPRLVRRQLRRLPVAHAGRTGRRARWRRGRLRRPRIAGPLVRGRSGISLTRQAFATQRKDER